MKPVRSVLRAVRILLRLEFPGLSLIVLLAACLQGFGLSEPVDPIEPSPLPSPAPTQSLEQAWKEAITAAHRLKASRKSSESALETFSAAKSTRYPSVTADGGHFWLDESPSAVVTIPGSPGLPVVLDNHFWAGGVIASLPLFTSGRIRLGVDAARAGWKAAQAEERRDTLDLKLDVANAYVSVLRATRTLRVAESHVSSLASHFRNVSNLYDKGFVVRNDLLASQVVLAEARQHEIQARNHLDISSAKWNRLLVRPLTNAVSLEDLRPSAAAEDVDTLTEQALHQRPELVVLSEQALALRKQARSVRASALPAIGLNGSYLHLESSHLERDHVWMMGVVGHWNLFDGGLTRHKARSVDAQSEATMALHAEALDGVSLQVRASWLEVDETRRRVEVARDAVTQAEENRNVTRDHYRTGMGTSAEVLDAETLRVRAHSNHDNAIYDSVMAGLRLRRAVGDL